MAVFSKDPYLAMTRNSLQWPKHWRAVIRKIEHQYRVLEDKTVIMVLPLNPEWEKQVEVGFVESQPFQPLPSPYLPPIEFDSIEAMDVWARVAARIK